MKNTEQYSSTGITQIISVEEFINYLNIYKDIEIDDIYLEVSLAKFILSNYYMNMHNLSKENDNLLAETYEDLQKTHYEKYLAIEKLVDNEIDKWDIDD